MGGPRRRSKGTPEAIRAPVLVLEKIGKCPQFLGRSLQQGADGGSARWIPAGPFVYRVFPVADEAQHRLHSAHNTLLSGIMGRRAD